MQRERFGCLMITVLVFSLSGCSFMTVERLESGYRRETIPRCSASILPIVGDGLSALILLTRMAAELETSQPETSEALSDQPAVLGTLGGVHFVSGVYGIWQRRRCNGARDAHENWIRERATPEPAPPGPPGAEIEP